MINMKSIATGIVILLLAAVTVAQRPGGPDFGIFNVPLDHFRPQDTRTVNFVSSEKHILFSLIKHSVEFIYRHIILTSIITMVVDRFSSILVMAM